MHAAPPSKSIWWKEPMVWLILGLPLTAVIASMITWWIAADGADSLVAEDYYKQGMAITQTMEKEARAENLGLNMQLRVQGGELRGHLQGRLDHYPDRLLLTLVHPTRDERDVNLVLIAIDQGEYRASLPTLPAGQRRLILQPEDQTWRLVTRVTLPLTAPVSLGAMAESSSP
ncbi:MAG: FixH family protein [Thiobacillaceae bacterium]